MFCTAEPRIVGNFPRIRKIISKVAVLQDVGQPPKPCKISCLGSFVEERFFGGGGETLAPFVCDGRLISFSFLVCRGCLCNMKILSFLTILGRPWSEPCKKVVGTNSGFGASLEERSHTLGTTVGEDFLEVNQEDHTLTTSARQRMTQNSVEDGGLQKMKSDMFIGMEGSWYMNFLGISSILPIFGRVQGHSWIFQCFSRSAVSSGAWLIKVLLSLDRVLLARRGYKGWCVHARDKVALETSLGILLPQRGEILKKGQTKWDKRVSAMLCGFLQFFAKICASHIL